MPPAHHIPITFFACSLSFACPPAHLRRHTSPPADLPPHTHPPPLALHLVSLCRFARSSRHRPTRSTRLTLSGIFLNPNYYRSMPLRCVGEIITVSHKKFTAVLRSFVQNRERLRREHQYPVIFRHVDGLNKFFEFPQGQSAYVVLKVSRTGLRLKKTLQKFRKHEILFIEKKFVSFEIWSNPILCVSI